MRHRVILFDIDGTLINTGGAGAVAWHRAFRHLYGVDVDIEQFSDNGMTDPDVGEATFEGVLGRKPNADEFQRLLENRLRYLRGAVRESVGYEVLPGVKRLIPSLLHSGYLLGLTTGNTQDAAHVKLHRSGLNRYFACGGYGSDSRDRGALTRRAVERARLVYGAPLATRECIAVGDTPRDVNAAHAAGIECVGVATLHYSTEDLQRAGADYVVASLNERLPF
jgi:phosphoglycolate phosphatase-like HAD superfamily hydrolase